MLRFVSRLLAICALLVFGGVAPALAVTKCQMTYQLKGWSAFYKTSRGTGHVSCTNGQEANVDIVTHGGGFSFGASNVVGGKGTFSQVEDISSVYGSYGEAIAHAGAGGSVDARVVTKGNVSLSLSGKGRGVNLGFAFGSFRVTPR
ncbi:MAG: hypothetical protein QF890_03310 [Myxococcota bacterium]|jgi:hypothetical protein|nr:hypothetical protein [bacterium]MDP6074210.1 hypothetical protein [Myxococcota bacterium]MDP6243056.1 hypothetical protein [Myxococcota bacterium]MDP7075806.1 hypothetical protein [Myxococcota bacterium]MDP7298556.1 hypothetical protein [Myxococcota bacterium]